MRRFLIAGMAMIMVGAACGGSAATPKPAKTATPGGAKGAMALGQTATLAGGVRATVKELTYPLAPKPRPGLTPGPNGGGALVGVLAEICAGDRQIDVSGFQFRLRLSDNTVGRTSLGEKDPPFITSTLAPGECNLGWVTFGPIRADQRPATVQYGVNGAIATWQIAQ